MSDTTDSKTSGETKPKKTPSQASVWLAKFGVKAGGWYQEVKISVQHAMRSAKFSEAARVWLCLRLHTIPYKSELALKTVRDKETGQSTRVSLTPADVAQETGMNRQQVRFGMAELEDEGMAERKPIQGESLHKGNVELYCYLVPHPPAKGKIVSVAGYNLPKEILKASRHFGIRFPADFVACAAYIEHVKTALTEYKEAEKVARKTVKTAFFVGPGAPAYKDDRNPLKEEAERDRRAGGSQSSNTVEPANQTTARPPADTPPEKAKPAEPRLVDLVLSCIADIRKAYPRSALAQRRFSPTSKSDRLLAERLLSRLNAETPRDVTGFFRYVADQFIKEGRSPDMADGPQSAALLVEWAGDYATDNGKADAAGGEL